MDSERIQRRFAFITNVVLSYFSSANDFSIRKDSERIPRRFTYLLRHVLSYFYSANGFYSSNDTYVSCRLLRAAAGSMIHRELKVKLKLNLIVIVSFASFLFYLIVKFFA